MTDSFDALRSADPNALHSSNAVPPVPPRWRVGVVAAAASTLAIALGALALHAKEADPQSTTANASVQQPGGAAGAPTGSAWQPPAGTAQLPDMIERVEPAVVNISVARSVTVGGPNGGRYSGPDPRSFQGTPFDELMRRFFEMNPDAQGEAPHVEKGQALGSGFLIDPSGYIVTNNHVIDDADEIKVTLNDGTEYSAKLQGRDTATDLALLKVDAKKPLPFVDFGDSEKARVGEWVVAVGNPFGLGGSATAGIISARGRDIRSGPFDDYLQIDAPINMGNSGGPVFDTQGRVIGINTAIFSPNGGSVGIGFAIPASLAQPVLAQLRDEGEVQRGWLGVEIQDLDENAAESLGLSDDKGALVASVAPDGPAAKAGIKTGDVIRSFDGKPVEHIKDLTRLVAATGQDKVPIEVWREGKMKKVSAEILRKDSESAALAFNPNAQAQHEASTGQLGLALAPVTQESRQEFQLDQEVTGAVIVDVRPDSSAAEQGLRPGDVIEMVNQQAVTEPQQVVAAAKEAASHDRKGLLLLVRRGEDKRFVTLNLG
jgi:serine protease Do